MGRLVLTSHLLSALFVAMGQVDIGLTLSYCSPALPGISKHFGWDTLKETMFNVCCTIVGVVAAQIMNPIIPIIGRRYSAMLSSAIAVVGWIAMGNVNTTWLMFLFRCILGLPFGFYTMISPVYVCELAPIEKRGAFGYLNQVMCAVGFMLPTIFGYSKDWRLISNLCAIANAILFIMSFFLPDSYVTGPAAPYKEVFKYPKQLVTGLTLMFFLQFSGVQAVISNLESIIVLAHISLDVSTIALIANICQVITTIAAAFAIDRWGRMACWTISSITQLVAYVLLVVYELGHTHYAVFLIGLFLEQLGYGIGTGPIPFMRCAELFPDEVRAHASSIISSGNCVLTVVVVLIWPYMSDSMGAGYAFLFYAVIQVLAIIFGVFVLNQPVPTKEVSNTSNNEIDVKDEEEDSDVKADSSVKEEI